VRARAFTLIELLIVVAIIAILAAIAVPNFLEAHTRAKVASAKASLRTLQTALESYAVDNNNYPYAETIGQTIWMPAGGSPRQNNNPTEWRPGGLTSPIAYITSIPNDPFKHPVSGIQVDAPLYYERAGFGFLNGNLTQMRSYVPSDSIGTSKLDGIGDDVYTYDDHQTPARFVLFSLGPDLNFFSSGDALYQSRYNLNNRYDPTNGTVSSGNVLRFPGGLSFP
jgi:type II secretion system protein G